MVSFNPLDVLAGWGRLLNTPLGWILIIGVIIYIVLRVMGILGSPLEGTKLGARLGFGEDRRGGQQGTVGKQQADYIIKR